MAGVGQTGFWKAGVWVEDLADPAEFGVSAVATLDNWEGDFTLPPSSGVFAATAEADMNFDWTPRFGATAGTATIFNGVPAVIEEDIVGRLVVVDNDGKVLCIIGLNGIELP